MTALLALAYRDPRPPKAYRNPRLSLLCDVGPKCPFDCLARNLAGQTGCASTLLLVPQSLPLHQLLLLSPGVALRNNHQLKFRLVRSRFSRQLTLRMQYSLLI